MNDLPVLKKIIAKASAAKDYGQLLAAEIRQTVIENYSSQTLNIQRF